MKMTTKEAFAYIEASRLQYNINCPEDQLDFEGTYNMILDCSPNVGTDKDLACLKAIHKAVDKARRNAEARLFRKHEESVQPQLVQRYLKEGFDQ
jgi:hypothetical protein